MTDSDTVSRLCRAPRSEKKRKSAGPRSNWRRPNGRLPFSTPNSTKNCLRFTILVCPFSSRICRPCSRPNKFSIRSCLKFTASWNPSSINWPKSRADGRHRAITGAVRRPLKCSRHPAAIHSTAPKTVNIGFLFLN